MQAKKDPCLFPGLDYARLKRSVEYFVKHYAAKRAAPGLKAVKVSAPKEFSRQNREMRDLSVAIADFVDNTQDFCGERVGEIDRDLQKRDAYTLSFLREHFSR